MVDGSGRPRFAASVAVVDGLIAAVGKAAQVPAARVVDADGAVVAPGFIDLHTHTDFTLPVYPRAGAMVRQGVTTQVAGNCGFSPFPVDPGRRAELIEYTSFIDAGLSWDWEDAGAYMAHLERLPLAGNIALQVGMGSVRLAAMGFDEAEPNEEQMDRMRRLVAAAFEAGVVGVSSGLVYPPGSFAGADEVTELARVAAGHGGFYSTHMRNEAGRLLDAVEEALEVGRRAGIPLQISHHKVMGASNWGKVEESLEMIERARSRGQDVMADQYPYRAGSTGFTQVLPGWALEGGIDAMKRRIADPATRARILAELRTGRADAIRDFDPELIVLAQVPDGPNRSLEGLSLADAAARRVRDPAELAVDLLAEEGAGILMLVFGMAEEDVRLVMQHPAVAVASDGWTLAPEAGGKPHPRSYGAYARVLGHYVREEGVLDLETAVHKMTGLPARRLPGLGLGLVRPGRRADLVVFDPATVRDTASFADPHQYCQGVQWVIVGGRPVVEHGEETGAAPGRVLRRVSR